MRRKILLSSLFVVFLAGLVIGALPTTAPADGVPKCCIIMVCQDPPYTIMYGKKYPDDPLSCQPDPLCTTDYCY